MNTNTTTIPNRKYFGFLSGSFLKVFAIVIMFIDHFAAGFIYPAIVSGDMGRWLLDFDIQASPLEIYDHFYLILRGIGRFAFPIFCYLLVEGYLHTRSKKRYAITLSIFGFISEIPFDIALIARKNYDTLNLIEIYQNSDKDLWEYQNVYFTLALGVLGMWAADTILKKLREHNIVLAYAASILPFAIAALAAYYMKTDYSHYGICVIAILYYFHNIRPIATLLAYLFMAFTMSTALTGGMEEWSFPAFILMNLYNGQRGFIKKNFKYFFYIFYPAHLILIFFLRYFILTRG
ncbi:TraX protein [Butyrivibrio fibrisolvens DSM 3071]|uniref:TraX protein n=1 Tax=Butyrivibrio fibrisolvens DSM 3071 TaxID=1121131 RepID=A0A1M6ATM6_BUTFI|nr:TraX family protein [Butyrivibrio fibrisolvens]SHI39812.1 TraX protein [Butyrivibrio fibrisolvens DSM 3071]